MLDWFKKHTSILITVLTCIEFSIYCYGCEAKLHSVTDINRLINRQELQLELNQLSTMAQIRMVELDKQEQLRAVILQNAFILVQGQPFNPVGLITAIAAVYGISQGGRNVKTAVQTARKKKETNNGRT